MIAGCTQRALSITAAAFMTLALAACQQPRPVVVLPPAELATCAAMPTAPSLPVQSPETQRERDILILGYILALRTAHADCFAKVSGLARWRESVE
jgi:hypothetical protein